MEMVYLDKLPDGVMIVFNDLLIVGTMKEDADGERKNSLAGNETA
jgi:hypothetical protein